jgi:aminopeptidase Y
MKLKDDHRLHAPWAGAGALASALLVVACGGGGDSVPTELALANGALCANRTNNNFDKLLECVTLEGVRAQREPPATIRASTTSSRR